MSRAEYDAIVAVNWSTLKHMDVSAKKYRRLIELGGMPDTPSMLFGRVSHAVVLEGMDAFQSRYCVTPDELPDANGVVKPWHGNRTVCREWVAAETREVIKPKEYDAAVRMLREVFQHPVAGPLVANIQPEQHFTWTDPDTGIACKACVDGIGPDHLVSFKTTTAETPEQFGRQYFSMGYHGQTAFYVDGYEDALGVRLPEVIVVAQTVEPFDVWVLDPPEQVYDEGRDLYTRLLRDLKDCRESGQYLGAVPTRQPLHVPAWAIRGEGESDLGDLGLEFGDEETC